MERTPRLGMAVAVAAMLSGLSPSSAQDLADEDGVPVPVGPAEVTAVAPKDVKDVAISASPIAESVAALAADPARPLRLAASSFVDLPDEPCFLHRSTDGGKRWEPRSLPRFDQPNDGCLGAAVAYAADGSLLQVASTTRRVAGVGPSRYEYHILVTQSDDNGTAWSTPVSILSQRTSRPGFAGFGKLAMTTPRGASSAQWFYLVAEARAAGPFGRVLFMRSADRGVTWTDPQVFPSAVAPSIAGGRGGSVLLAWAGRRPSNVINVAWSSDHGDSFRSSTTVAADGDGDDAAPAVTISEAGDAHVVYQGGTAGTELRYVYSLRPPYDVWSTPVTIVRDIPADAIAAPSLQAQRCGSISILHLAWARFANQTENPGVFYARKLSNRSGWTPSLRISDLAARPEARHEGSDLVATASPFVAWSDGRNKRDAEDVNLDLYGSRIKSGVTCP